MDSIRATGSHCSPSSTPGPADLHRVPRTAVYAVADPGTVPQALLHNLKHNQVLHERNVILTVVFRRGARGCRRTKRVRTCSRWATASGA
jgi:KUP system potassium uptake protein